MKTKPDFAAARQEWMERYGSHVAQAKNWRIAALSSIAIAGLFGVGMVYEADRVHVVPYVVEVDKLGQTVELAQAVRSGSFSQPIVRHLVSRFVWLLWTRNPEVPVQKHWIDQSYYLISSKAQSALSAFYAEHKPYSAYTNKTDGQTVTISSAESVGNPTATGGSYIVDFSVKSYGPHGGMDGVRNWQATITYAKGPLPADASTLEHNPFGVFVTHFAFSPQL